MLTVSTDVRHKAGFSDKFWWIFKEVFVMKTWRTPEMKVYSVKMDENIANSGDGGESSYEVQYIYYDLGGITRGGTNYNCSLDGKIQDTSVSYAGGSRYKTVPYSQVNTISKCIA